MSAPPQWYLGLTLLSVVVVLWVASGFFMSEMADLYTKPYFVTYINTSLMSLYLPLGLRNHNASQHKFSVIGTAKLSLIFFVLWFLSNLLSNAGYYYTTVQSATIISCSSSFFTLIIGAYFGVERFALSKLGPLLISACGIALITSQDGREVTAPSFAMLGNTFAFGSAILYGFYTTLLKRQVGDERNLNTKLFFGFVGVYTLLGLWPMVYLLDYFNIEKFALPPSPKIWWLLCLNGVVIIISDFCWVLSTLMTSPLLVSVGLSATIPLSMLGEVVFHHRYASPPYLIGALLVGYSFYAINASEEHENDTRRESELLLPGTLNGQT